MSGDPEQEYFSDGISEDIITDLSKVSALSVVARNTAFALKGKSVDVTKVAARLKVSHLLEGSVRKVGGRVRITAQLVDGVAGDHVWAERYDRELTDIFTVQDEISQAIVAALKVKLLPDEKKAIGKRGTTSAEAYDLYLMARQYREQITDDPLRHETTIRLCERAVAIDPNYALAWTVMGAAQMSLFHSFGRKNDAGAAAIAQAVALDPNLGEARALRARELHRAGRREEALAELEIALRLDPDSYDVNYRAGTDLLPGAALCRGGPVAAQDHHAAGLGGRRASLAAQRPGRAGGHGGRPSGGPNDAGARGEGPGGRSQQRRSDGPRRLGPCRAGTAPAGAGVDR